MTQSAKRSVIEDITFGGRTAEEESEQLAHYFVETEQWRKVWQDEVDVVFAPKGGGKSAIYSMLVSREDDLFDRSVVLVPGENPTGATAFEPIQIEPPTSETEFIRIWRLYFLVLLVEELERYDVQSDKLRAVREVLASIGLTKGVEQKRAIIVRVRNALRKFFSPDSVEAGMSIDPNTGMPSGFTAKATFDEPSVEQEEAGIVSVDRLYEDVNDVLMQEKLNVWLIIDRLDVAFTASPELEANALRALFRVYRLFEPLGQLRLKIFLRSDIWSEITAGGFRETSHITRDMNLRWNRASLLKLIVQRVIQSGRLTESLGVDSGHVIASSEAQQELFNRVFPRQVDAGSKRPATFDWALSRVEDGKKVAAPRELIHLFTTVRDRQLDRIDTGEAAIVEDVYFESQAFRDAHPEVSETRLQKTIYPEYPWLKDWLEALRGQRTQQDTVSLEVIWGTRRVDTEERIRRLVDIGFFEQRGSVTERTYWVPFLYRPALEMVQGAADGLRERAGVSSVVDEDDLERDAEIPTSGGEFMP
ncbi:P-loop ATPase, Sll1717 family [Promicromonospora sp. MS192]|uniref:P-loop ATPase, Sll1717 family n=1 Tax=Promicromonospora sp. MS192 TaxID=3412684 RepID=UPI003C30296B